MDAVAKKKVCLKYIPSQEQLADALTKPLGRVSFQRHIENMGLYDYDAKRSLVQGGVSNDHFRSDGLGNE